MPQPATLPALFAAQAARTPDAAAVIFEDRVLSYAALDARANRLAHHLRSLGVGPGRAGRGLRGALARDWWWACSAMLKAGGAYLPLDPELPGASGWPFMLADAGRCWCC